MEANNTSKNVSMSLLPVIRLIPYNSIVVVFPLSAFFISSSRSSFIFYPISKAIHTL